MSCFQAFRAPHIAASLVLVLAGCEGVIIPKEQYASRSYDSCADCPPGLFSGEAGVFTLYGGSDDDLGPAEPAEGRERALSAEERVRAAEARADAAEARARRAESRAARAEAMAVTDTGVRVRVEPMVTALPFSVE
ncbi:MAG: hypothetical protein AAFP17_04575 [Pseudomonadota bacterium]